MRLSPRLALLLGLVLVSTAGPMLVMAHMDAFAIAFFRLSIAGVLLAIYAALRGTLRVPQGELPRVLAGGALLGLHFALWVKAFDLTSYASNLLLLVSQPAFGVLIGVRLGERHGRDTWISLSLSLLGLLLIGGADLTLGARALLGDALCLAAAFFVTVFVVLTRKARAEMHLPAFLSVTFLSGALALVPFLVASKARLGGYPPASWLWLVALVLLTTIGGHGLMNLAARNVRLFTLNLVIVLEPPLAIAMGAILFGAGVHPLQLVGGAILAAAVVIGMRPELAREPATASALPE